MFRIILFERCAMKNTLHKLILFSGHIIIPLFIGGAIYILFRTENLKMFQWFESMNLGLFVKNMRTFSPLQSYECPYWVVFCLPNALWIYSLTAYLLLVWKNSRGAIFWFLLGPAIGLSSELLQLTGAFPGTFDGADLAFTAVFSAFPLITIYPFRKEKRQ
ncbi:hypothetical protein JXA84_05950 [candidate division WOR-3 bacterium]|nr:hypothetical protein [candidate division WOR-3 bacterium]